MAEQATFDMDRVLADLVSTEERAPEWLRRSYAEPARFVEALFDKFHSSQGTAIKSSSAVRYDFYNDMVLRHTESDKTAWVSYAGGAAVELSYDDLHERSSRLVSQWSAHGVAAGTPLCIALPFGQDYVVALMTALRMGAIVTPVPDPVTTLARRRVIWSGAPFVVAEPTDMRHLEEATVILAPRSRQTARTQELPHAYQPEEPCLRLFSAFASEPELLCDVSAAAAFTGPLRDALLAFSLRSGDRVAAPDFNLTQYQPALLLMSLLAGATYVHIPLRLLAEQSHVRDDAKITVLGIAPGLRDRAELLTDSFTSEVRLWFRSLTERLDLHSWESVDKRFEDKSIRSLSIACNAAFGGCFAFSQRRVQQLALALFPAPGEPWMLEETNKSGMPALGSAGLLSHPGDGARLALGQFIFSWTRQRYTMAASIDFTRSGRGLFVSLYEELVMEVEGIERAGLVLAPSDAPNDSNLLLVCFIDPLRGARALFHQKLREEIEATIVRSFGEELLPNRIAIYTIRPKLNEEGVLDRRWCGDQYLSGALTRKQAEPLFKSLSQLSKVVQLMQEA